MFDKTFDLNEGEKNSFENSLNELFSKHDSIYSTIINNLSEPDSSLKTIMNYNELIKENKAPYPNKDIIPDIKIKDKDYFMSGEKIENYIKSLSNFDDNSFNKCDKCKNRDNLFFCKKCLKNICDACLKIVIITIMS